MQTIRLPSWLFRLYQLLFLLLPWSVEAGFGAWKLSVPAEPLIAMTGVGLAFVFVRQRMFPPLGSLAWIGLAWVLWQAVAAGCSSMPVVSWKYWLVEAGHWWVFFVGLLCWPGIWRRLIYLFGWSMLGVALYTIVHHSFYQFRADQAMLAPMPFFADHTVYSLVLGMVAFYFLGDFGVRQKPKINLPERPTLFKFQISNFKFPIQKTSQDWKLPFYLKFEIGNLKFEKVLARKSLKLMAAGLVLTAIALAASRAAWLSILLSGMVGLALNFRPRQRWLFLGAVFALGAGLFFQKKITTHLAKDVSAQERLNRYACALRMADEKPVTGFGPGTFQFQYLPFQKPEEMTRISRVEPVIQRGPDNYGRGGGAHSEYLQALSELGWPGLALWLSLVFFSLGTGIRRFQQTRNLTELMVCLGLLSFFLHGLVNNFLHDGRVAALVWAGVAAIAINIRDGHRFLKSKCKM